MSESAGARDGLSSVTRGTLYLFVATLCFIGLNFVARVILVRTISVADWNAYSFGLALISFVIAVGTLGLPTAIARSLPYASSDAQRRSMVRAALIIGGAAAFVSGLLLELLGPWIVASLHFPGLGPVLVAFPIAASATIAVTLLAAIFQGYEDVRPNALFIQVLPPGLFIAFLLGAYLLPPTGVDYGSALIAYTAANVVALLLAIGYFVWGLRRRLPAGPGAPGAARTLLVFAAPLLLVATMSALTSVGDTIVLGAFDTGGVGTYANSVTLARLVTVGVGAAAYIFLPVAARLLRQNDLPAIGVTYVTVTKWMSLFSLPLFLLFVFVPSRSLDLVYGSSYASVVLPLQIVASGAFLTTALGPATNAQVAFGQTRWLAINAVIAGVLDIGTAILLVPHYGLTGAAVAWAASNITYVGLSLGQLTYFQGVHPFRPHYVVPLIVTAIPVAAVLVLAPWTWPLWALPVVGLGIALLFVLVILLTRSVDEGDQLLLGALENLFGRPLPLLRRIGRLGLPRGKS
ncbi:MAG TPA: oligosaccharide flippase family protein [Thermoplasmata archaeon]|nr:oligosaccharide flippase family protein [Thermoplasmata archaeon]